MRRAPPPARREQRGDQGRKPRRGAQGGQEKTAAPDFRRTGGRSARNQEELRRRAQSREIRWHNNRMAVPYYTDGPKITFGVLWVVVLAAAAVVSPVAVAVVAGLVAAGAGLQTGAAWFPQHPMTRWWTAGAALVVGLSGGLGPLGIVAGAGVGLLVLLGYTLVFPTHNRPIGQLVDVLVRSALPVGVAAASLAALRDIDIGVVLLLVALISAYEAGDFLVGSGSMNAIEGPLSGLMALGVVAFIAWILAPAPFSNSGIVLFSALAGVCCPLGQILASALLPRGSAWAPALRRLDSYLLAAPLWLLLLSLVDDAGSL